MVDLKLKIPDGFLEEEVRWGYTVSRKMKEVWAVELDLLAELDRVCKKYGITYIASGGTMLGAVRHKGFIPWDDDIDVMMTRDQYDNLLSVAANEFQYPYFFQTSGSDNDYFCGYSKLRNSNTAALEHNYLEYKYNQGIFIDIFPLDNSSDSKFKYKWQIIQAKYFLRMSEICKKYVYGMNVEGNWLKRKIVDLMYFLFHKSFPNVFEPYSNIKNLEHVCHKYNNEKTTYISLMSFQPGNRIHDLYLTDMDHLIESDFEFIKIMIPQNYDSHLRRKFGEYNVPLNTGGYHGGVIFDTDKSYISYLKEK